MLPLLQIGEKPTALNRAVELGVASFLIVAFVVGWYGQRVGLGASHATLLGFGFATAVALLAYFAPLLDRLPLPEPSYLSRLILRRAELGLVLGVIAVAALLAIATRRLRPAAFLGFTVAYLALEYARLLLITLTEATKSPIAAIAAVLTPALLVALQIATWRQRRSIVREIGVLVGCMVLCAGAFIAFNYVMHLLRSAPPGELTLTAAWFLPNMMTWAALNLARPHWRTAAAGAGRTRPTPAAPARPRPAKRRDLPADRATGATALHRAAEAGDLAGLKSLLARGAPVDGINALNGATALHYAAENGRVAIVRELIARGADVNLRTVAGNTPLITAAVKGYEQIVGHLLDCDASVDAVNREGATALFMAAQRGHTGAVRQLLTKADPNAQTTRGATALHVAAEYGHAEVARLLLEKGAEPDRPTIVNKDTPLHDAAQKGHTAIVAVLLDVGADPNRADRAGNTTLHIAAAAGHAAIVRLLLDKGCDRSRRNDAGYTPAGVTDDAAVIALLKTAAWP